MLKQSLRHVLYQCVGIIAACAPALVSATAADITFDDQFYSVQLEGKIVSGDYEKLRSVADDLGVGIRGNPHQAFHVVLHLFSPGGELPEAMKIGRLVRALHWMTDAPQNYSKPSDRKRYEEKLKEPGKNYLCASACFFVFVAGVERYGGYRTHIAPLILGIQRPYLSDVELKATSSTDAIASAETVRAVGER